MGRVPRCDIALSIFVGLAATELVKNMVVVVVAFSWCARILGECSTIYSVPAGFLFVLFFNVQNIYYGKRLFLIVSLGMFWV